MGVSVSSFGQVGEANPLQYAAIAEGTSLLNSTINSQTKGMQKTAAFQGTIAAEFTKMKQWEGKYNAYLKTASMRYNGPSMPILWVSVPHWP